MDRLPAAELEVLKLLWKEGPCTARRLQAARKGRKPWARTTVLTLLKRLEERGLVSVDRTEWSHRFSAAVDRETHLDRTLGGLADEYCDGSPLPLVQALMRGRKLSPKEVRELEALIRTLDRRGRRS